ncbi:DUF975 family protein [Pseudobacillus badius]|uniref:DUF975 family protein n=1 Tax=Bacillus badius TaxID=1455 RepID=UPI003D34FF57
MNILGYKVRGSAKLSYGQLREEARGILKGKWLKSALFTLPYLVILQMPQLFSPSLELSALMDEGQDTLTQLGGVLEGSLLYILSTLLLLPLTAGFMWAWIDLSRGDSIGIRKMFKPYQSAFVKSILTLGLQTLFTFFWFILLFIPGIIKSFSYMMSVYILRDRPELSPLEAITESRRLMNGHKKDAFLLGLTFFGWFLLIVSPLLLLLVPSIGQFVYMHLYAGEWWVFLIFAVTAAVMYFAFLFLMSYVNVTFSLLYNQLVNTENKTT